MTIGLVPLPRSLRMLPGVVRLGRPDEADVVIDAAIGLPAEGYRLRVTDDGVRIDASDAAGAFYGARTLRQLVRERDGGWECPRVEIEDAPRFAYRGVMLDVARHFFPVATVCAYIDHAADLKFNALHLHLSDDQGWRLEMHSRPELTARAAGLAAGGDEGGFYTQDDYRTIVEYAARRHMTVVPEFDMPGHTHAVGLAYPELAAAPVLSAEIERTTAEYAQEFGGDLPKAGVPYTGIAVGFSSLRIYDEATYAFVRDVFTELAALTPGPYLHLGGDEALGTSPEDYALFVRRAAEIVAATGKVPVAWHEAGAVAGLPAGTIGQYWGFVEPTADAAADARAIVAGGGRLIVSPADAAYLDMKPDAASTLGLTWANGPTSLEDAYGWDPARLIPGVGEADVLGVEAPMWTETIRTLADIEAMAFPRIAALAEVAWSPASAPLRTWPSFQSRVALAAIR